MFKAELVSEEPGELFLGFCISRLGSRFLVARFTSRGRFIVVALGGLGGVGSGLFERVDGRVSRFDPCFGRAVGVKFRFLARRVVGHGVWLAGGVAANPEPRFEGLKQSHR